MPKSDRSEKSGVQVTLSRFFEPARRGKRSQTEENEDGSDKIEENQPKRYRLDSDEGKLAIKKRCDKLQAFCLGSSPAVQVDPDIPKDSGQDKTPKCVEKYTKIKFNSPVDDENVSDSVPGTSSRADDKKVVYTPLEKQFMEIKQKYPDTILFVECGYKYRFFGDDAKVAAKELNIFAHPINNFMSASIPTHRLQVHLQRLVSKGYKVGVVRQTETAALKAAGENKNAPFSRKLDGLYTRATFFGHDLSSETNVEASSETETLSGFGGFILCISEKEHSNTQTSLQKSPLERSRKKKDDSGTNNDQSVNFGIIAVQPSTGCVMYDHFIDTYTRAELETRMELINPSEIVTSTTISQRTKDMLNNTKLRTNNAVRWDEISSDLGEEDATFLNEFYGDEDLQAEQNEGCGGTRNTDNTNIDKIGELPEVVKTALVLAIRHLRHFMLDDILRDLKKLQKFASDSNYMKINGVTFRNLEIFKNLANGGEKGTLFGFINHTCTLFGRRLLRSWMSKPLISAQLINERLCKVAAIKACWDLPLWTKIQKEMQLLPDLQRGIALIQYTKASPQEFLKIITAFNRIAKELTSHAEEIKGIITLELERYFTELPQQVLPITRSYLDLICAKEAGKGDKTKLFKDKSRFPKLSSCFQDIEETLSELESHKTNIRKILRNFSLDYVTVSGNEFLIEVKKSNVHLVPQDWIKVMSTKQVDRYRPPDVDQSFKRLCQLRETLAMEADKAWIEFLRSCMKDYDILHRSVRSLAELDCLLSLAKLATHSGFVRPTIDDTCRCIKIKNGFHPVIHSLLAEQQQYVRNDTNLSEKEMRCMVITGPNMGGKSSYIKQVALVSFLAQLGSFVPADEATLYPLDAIYTRMGASDDIASGRSTFMIELEEASEILRNCTDKSLVILDELGRGTATHDGTAIAFATLEHLISKVSCFTLFVTHYPMLGEFENKFPGVVANFHMGFVYTDNDEEHVSTEKGERCSLDQLARTEHVQEITFLYKLERGLAAKSYGLNVAKLANMPTEILQKASQKARDLEKDTHRRRLLKLLMREADAIDLADEKLVEIIHAS